MKGPYDAGSFEALWPHYVRLHTRPGTQQMHAAATLSCIALLASGLALHQPLLLLAAPLVNFAIAQASHRAFEQNRTTPWKNQLWHTRAELRMLGLVLTGRMAEEVDRAAVPH